MKEIKRILPTRMQKITEINGLEEIRLRLNQPIIIRQNGNMRAINDLICSQKDIESIIQIATNYSFYAYLEYFKCGFITISGGHRIGICGEILCEDNVVQNFKKITSINIRIAQKSVKIPKDILNSVKNHNTLIISPPNIGKTTLLREIVRYLSNDMKNISVVDERFEISGRGEFDLGVSTDVILGLTKHKAAMMMLKTMSPDYIVLDEITDDTEILQQILFCGVYIIATIHGDNLKCIKSTEILKFFTNFVEISLLNGQRIYKILGEFND